MTRTQRGLTGAQRTLAVAFCLGLSSFAWADYENGQVAYERGDYRTAFAEFKQAAQQGILAAEYRLGQMYRKGQGVVQSDALALAWLRSAAEQGHSAAELSLGFMYYTGDGVPRDYVQAYMWFDLAASQIIDPAERDAARKHRETVALLMTPTQVAEAQRLSREIAFEISGPHCGLG